MKLPASPVGYAGIGRVFLANAYPPDGLNNTSTVLEDSDGKSIVIEFEDYVKVAINNTNGNDDPVDPMVRYFFHFRDARFLVYHLLHSLAQANDEIVVQLKDVLDEVMKKEKLRQSQ